MSFKSLFSKVSSKVNLINTTLPGLAEELTNNVNRSLNSIKAEGLANLNSKIGDVAGGLGLTGLSSSVGGNVFASMHPKTFKSNLSAKPGPIGYSIKPGELVPGESQPPWPNELEEFASMNCIITLAALSHKEINDPDNTYRKDGLKNIVCKTGGGAGVKKNKTQVEKALGANVEFFIDDLNLKAIAQPSISYGGNSNVTNISFKVQEPYSMGLFYQALKLAAAKAGFIDYTTACFVIMLEFKGWSVDGTQVEVPYSRRLLPIKLTTSSFVVNEGGSEYQVEGIAWNEVALKDSVQQIKTDLSLRGRTVREVLQTGAFSLTGLINKRLQDLEEAKHVDVADQYIIVFPTDPKSTSTPTSDSSAGMNRASVNPGYGPDEIPTIPVGGVKTYDGSNLETWWQSINGSETAVPSDFSEYMAEVSGNVKSANNLELMLKKYAASDFSNNQIGSSSMIGSPHEGGTQPMPEPKFAGPPHAEDAFLERQAEAQQFNDKVAQNKAFDAEFPIFSRANANMQLDGEVRTFKFAAGMRVQEIVEEILISSMYGRELAQQLRDLKDPFGMIEWFTIETDVYPIPTSANIAKTGNPPTIHVYRIVPYMVHASLFKAPAAASPGIPELKAQAAKEYNYIYTGRNKDILDFQIQYNNSFIYPVLADRGSSSGAQSTGAAGTQIAPDPEPSYTTGGTTGNVSGGDGVAKTVEAVNTNTGNSGGSGNDNSQIGIARMFNDRFLNSLVDMIQVEMTILGDPFYISDNGNGNYHAGDTSYINMTEDGHANYANGELHVNVLFRTPLDIDPDRGDYIFPEELITVDTFSGLYKVAIIDTVIVNNEFTTKLTMVRVRDQEDQTQTQNLGAIIETENPSESLNQKATDYAMKVSDAVASFGTTENLQAYQKEIQSLLGGYHDLGSIVQKQAGSLGLPALDIFGNIGSSLSSIQDKLGQAALGKIGSSFGDIQGALGGQLASLQSQASSFANQTLSQVNLSGGDVLGSIGSKINNTVGNVDLKQLAGNIPSAQVLASSAKSVTSAIPTNIEAAATANAEKLAKLNTQFTNRGPR